MTRSWNRRRRHLKRPRKPESSGRRLSYDVLTAWQQRGAYAGRVIDDLCRERRVTAADRAFAVDLTYTLIRRQATIDAILSAFVTRSRRDVEDGLWRLLQIGCCQLIFMDRVPPHAAVHETAGLCRELQQPQWTGMVNGVLRSLSGAIGDITTTPAADAVPIGEGRFRRLDRAVFPSPEEDAVEYLTRAYSYPRWLVRDWLERFGPEETARLCEWFNRPSLPSVRVNTLRATVAEVQEVLSAAGVPTQPGRFPESLIAEASFRPLDIAGFGEGAFSIQDESAMAAGRLLDPQPGESVLDLCAAPGGKTAHLAELMQDSGRILATDIDAERLRLVSEGAARLGLNCIETLQIAADGHDLPEGPLDAVLVDVPCSNTGVLGKRPEARWRTSPESITELIPVQVRLLTQALQRVRPGGRVVYSTCSIDPRENREVVDSVLSSIDGVTLEQEQLHVPGQPADGGYQALLRKSAAARATNNADVEPA
jgi:16S rRNA (cytosine967-C5)-methyltransferase